MTLLHTKAALHTWIQPGSLPVLSPMDYHCMRDVSPIVQHACVVWHCVVMCGYVHVHMQLCARSSALLSHIQGLGSAA